jgi:hypothetical protein
MSVKYLPVLAIALLAAGCNRQRGQQAVSTTTPAQAATPAAGRDPEPVERTAPPKPELPPVSARVVDEPSQPRETRAEAGHPAEAVIPASTRIRVRLGDSLDSKINRAGERFSAYLDEPIVSGSRVVIPKGTLFRGHVVQARSSGRLRGQAYLGVTLDSFRLRGMTYAIATGADARTGSSHKQRNAVAIGGGSGMGAAIGAVAGGGAGALIGAGAGAAAGTTGSFITGRKNVRLPVETPLVFSLRNAVTVRG